ncbi:MAG: carboxymuconolactone decarboxylase family protein [Afipia sp.]|nr:carboxymuconolactone decarboxylase family protein [Afipia sp.]
MKQFPSLPDNHQLDAVFKRFPQTAAPLLEYLDRVMRDPSPLTVAERELIAAYVSGLNACTYCHGAHVLAASAFGIDEALFEGLMSDLATSAIDEKLKPILAYVGKLTLTPSRLTGGDAQAVYDAGWDEQALFDAISVGALFNLMNRIVEGTGTRLDPLDMPDTDKAARKARLSGVIDRSDPYRAERSYSKLVQTWGIPL